MTDYFDPNEQFSIFDLIDDSQPHEDFSAEVAQMLNEVEYYDDYSYGIEVDNDYD